MAVSFVVATFLGLHLLAIAFPGPLWGVDSLAYYPAWVARLVAGAAVPLLIPSVRRWLATKLGPGRGATPAATWFLGVGVLAVLVAILGWRFPSAVPLLGDGRLQLDGLQQATLVGDGFQRGAWADDNAPLSSFTLGAVNRLLADRGGTPIDTFRIVSLVAGVAWTLLAGIAARSFATGYGSRIVLAFLLGGGFLQLFFGYVEVYPLLFPMGLGVLLLARVENRAGRRPLGTGILLGVATAFHFALVTLAPIVLAAAFSRSAARRAALLGGGLSLAAGAATTASLLVLVGFDFGGYLQTDRAPHFLPWFAEPTYRQAYRVLSPAHLLDLLNVLLLVAPAALLALPFARRIDPTDPDLRLLGAASAGPLLFLLLANPEIGAFRDWDTLAFVAIPVSLLAAVALARTNGERAREAGVAAAAIALLHTGLWIGVNAHPDRALPRFTDRLETSATSPRARAYGWEALGGHYRDAGQSHPAAQSYERAAGNATNPRLWALAGDAWHKTRDLVSAERAYRRALDLDPEHARGLSGLGALTAEQGDWSAAIPLLQRSVDRDPLNVYGWWLLGLGHRETGQPHRALDSFRRALEGQPSYAVAWLELGRTELSLQRWEPAREALTTYLELAPNTQHSEWARTVLRDLASR